MRRRVGVPNREDDVNHLNPFAIIQPYGTLIRYRVDSMPVDLFLCALLRNMPPFARQRADHCFDKCSSPGCALYNTKIPFNVIRKDRLYDA